MKNKKKKILKYLKIKILVIIKGNLENLQLKLHLMHLNIYLIRKSLQLRKKKVYSLLNIDYSKNHIIKSLKIMLEEFK